jgi:hypothetical protein
MVAPVDDAKFPAEQSVHAVAPADAENEPTAHGRQALEEFAPDVSKNVPEGHKVHVVAPADIEYDPPGQFVQDELPEDDEKVPAEHKEQSWLPVVEADPAGHV